MAVPKRRISTMALVTNAAFEFAPKFMPSQIPAPIAIIFLRAPPNSTPRISWLV